MSKIEIRIDSPRLARVKTSFEVYGVSRPTHVGAANRFLGLPDTWQYEGLTVAENNFVALTESIQWLWYSENVKLTPELTEFEHWKEFESLTADDRYITNGDGSDTKRVYPTGKNPTAEDMRYYTLLTGNAIIEIAGENKTFAGVLHTPFRCINASLPVEKYTKDKYPHLWYRPTTSNRKPKAGGGWEENFEFTFSQFNDKCITPLLMPNTNIGWINTDLLVFL